MLFPPFTIPWNHGRRETSLCCNSRLATCSMPEFGCKLWALEPSVTAMAGPEVDPTRGPPPNQGSQGSPLLMEGWKVATFWMVGNVSGPTFWKPFFSCFFCCENVDINGSLNRRKPSCCPNILRNKKLCCFFQCEPSVKVVPEDDPWKRLWTCLLAPNHGLMMIEDSPREPRNHVMTSMKCHGSINPSNSSVLRMVQFWVTINTIVILHVIAQLIKKF